MCFPSDFRCIIHPVYSDPHLIHGKQIKGLVDMWQHKYPWGKKIKWYIYSKYSVVKNKRPAVTNIGLDKTTVKKMIVYIHSRLLAGTV